MPFEYGLFNTDVTGPVAVLFLQLLIAALDGSVVTVFVAPPPLPPDDFVVVVGALVVGVVVAAPPPPPDFVVVAGALVVGVVFPLPPHGVLETTLTLGVPLPVTTNPASDDEPPTGIFTHEGIEYWFEPAAFIFQLLEMVA
jgi:hypothetical protein